MRKHIIHGGVVLRIFACVASLAAMAGCALSGNHMGSSWLSVTSNAVPDLSEPDGAPLSINYATERSAHTLASPVVMEFNGKDIICSVVGENLFGTPVIVGRFPGGEIVAREFGRFAQANFREPVGDEKPVARLCVSLASLTVSRPMLTNAAESYVRVTVRLVDADGGKTGYSRDFDASLSCDWNNESEVPRSFYGALGRIMAKCVADWSASRVCETIQQWAGVAEPGLRPPELASAIEWSGSVDEGVVFGKCRVACNDYEGFRAKSWAVAQIFEECRRKMGGIETERLRVVYDADGERFDVEEKKWTLSFHAFARAERVLSFDKTSRSGFVTGDLGLMGVPADTAAEALKTFVMSEMDSRAGAVSSDSAKGRALVRFDNFTTDKTYNLITIRFRLVY